MIRIQTPSPFLAGPFQESDPDAYEVVDLFWSELGDSEFQLRAALQHLQHLLAGWPDDRVWAACRRLFFFEVLTPIPETIH
jgi:hypothetical protein